MKKKQNGQIKRVLLCLLAVAVLMAGCSGCTLIEELAGTMAVSDKPSFFSTLEYKDGNILVPPLELGMTCQEVVAALDLQPEEYNRQDSSTYYHENIDRSSLRILEPIHYTEFGGYDVERLLLFSTPPGGLISICYQIVLWDTDYKDSIKIGKSILEKFDTFCTENGGSYRVHEEHLPIDDFVDNPTLYQNSLHCWEFEKCKVVFRLIHTPVENNTDHPDANHVFYMEIRVDYKD